MSDDTKTIYINVKDLSFKSEEHIENLSRFLAEQIPQLEINHEGNEIEVEKPINLSKRVIRLRLRKFLYKKKLKEDFRAISFNEPDKDGYSIKEKREVQITYY